MGERISISTPDGEFRPMWRGPKRPRGPAVVVIQEIFGVNQVMRDITDALASQGYLALCPDLFWRMEPGIDITDKTEAEWKRAFELFNAFDVDQGVEGHQGDDQRPPRRRQAATARWARWASAWAASWPS